MNVMKEFLSLIFLICSAYLTTISGQKMSAGQLQKFLTEASQKTEEYTGVFKNLSATETKIFENFDDNGRLNSRKALVSDFIVYESVTNKGNLAEYRNVRKIDGRPIKNADKRTVKLFEKIADADSFQKELEKLTKESLRYDKNLQFSGFTLFQNIPLAEDLKSSFIFKEIGREIVDGNEVIVVSFQQTAPHVNIKFNISAPKFLQISNSFFSRNNLAGYKKSKNSAVD